MAFRPAAINVEGAVHGLIKRGEIPPIIAVGIDNGASTKESKSPVADRANEFLPDPDVRGPRSVASGSRLPRQPLTNPCR
jgi:hypothetical protein